MFWCDCINSSSLVFVFPPKVIEYNVSELRIKHLVQIHQSISNSLVLWAPENPQCQAYVNPPSRKL